MEENNYPSVVFKLNGVQYAIDSRHVTTIIQKPRCEALPGAPDYIKGIFKYRDTVLSMLDLRSFLGMETVQKEKDDFRTMIQARKQDHINWVNALDHSIQTDAPFTLAKNPHDCAFGHWYYNFKSESQHVSYVLNKIEDPHAMLHNLANEALECKTCEAVDQIHNKYMPKVLSLLDDIEKEVTEDFYQEMVIILSHESNLGLVVDEILSVSDLEPAQGLQSSYAGGSKCVSGAIQEKKSGQLILALDINELIQIHNSNY